MVDIELRQCLQQGMGLLAGRVLEEGWNLGLQEAEGLFRVDSDGHFLAVAGEEVVGCISALALDPALGGIAFHSVKEAWRGQGLEARLLELALQRLGDRPTGLTCRADQVAWYERFGFRSAHRILHFEGACGEPAEPSEHLVCPFAHPLNPFLAFDRTVFPFPRKDFLAQWLNQPQTLLQGRFLDGAYQGYGLLQPCWRGHRIGPLLARDEGAAEDLLTGLLAHLPAGGIYTLALPEPNGGALALARRRNLRQVRETVRMYRGPAPGLALDQVYGFSSPELL